MHCDLLSASGDLLLQTITASLQWIVPIFEMIVPFLHVMVVTLLFLLTGIALSISWIYVPMLVDPIVAPQITLVHFRRLVNQSFRHLRVIERLLVVGNLVMVFSSYRNSDAAIHWRWPHHLASALVLAQMLWYDMLFLLPIEDEILNLDGGGGGNGGSGSNLEAGEPSKRADEEVSSINSTGRLKKIKGNWEVALLVQKWEMVHRVRICFPAFAAVISLAAVVGD